MDWKLRQDAVTGDGATVLQAGSTVRRVDVSIQSRQGAVFSI